MRSGTLTKLPFLTTSDGKAGMMPPSTTGLQLYAAADELNVSRLTPRRHLITSAASPQPAFWATSSKRGWSVSGAANDEVKDEPDSRMAPRKRSVESRPQPRSWWLTDMAPALQVGERASA